MADSNTLVWFITGANRGIGRAVAERALEAGYRVAGTARKTDQLQDLVQAHSETFLPLKLDVDVPQQIDAAAQEVLNTWGQVDVLVNNAGYGLAGALEETSMAQARSQMETNVFGLLGVTKAFIPGMRLRQRGWIFNVSSIAGMRGIRGLSIYNASKFAVVGISEALAQELKPFNIHVGCVEPGPYRTDWAGDSLKRTAELQAGDDDSPYADLNTKVHTMMDQADGQQPGDPYQIADVLVDAVQQPSPGLPTHLIFGDEAISIWESKQRKYTEGDYLALYPHRKRTLWEPEA